MVLPISKIEFPDEGTGSAKLENDVAGIGQAGDSLQQVVEAIAAKQTGQEAESQEYSTAWADLPATLEGGQNFVQAAAETTDSTEAGKLYQWSVPQAIDGAAKGTTWDTTEQAKYTLVGEYTANSDFYTYAVIPLPPGYTSDASTVALIRSDDGSWYEVDDAGAATKIIATGDIERLDTAIAAEQTARTDGDAAIQTQIDAIPAPFSRNYTDLTNRPTIPVISTDADLGNDPTAIIDRATLKTVLDSLNLGKWLPSVANMAARDALTGVVENDKVRVLDAGAGTWINYQATAASPAPQWLVIAEEDTSIVLPALSEADAIAGTSEDDSTITAKTLDVAINAAVEYDLRSTYGLNQRVYDGPSGNYYKSLIADNQGNALNDGGAWEADLDSTSVYIRNLGPVPNLTNADLALKFPVGDESRPLDIITVGDTAYQQKIGTANPQLAANWEPVSIPGTRILNKIVIPLRSAGTNAGSAVNITFFDRDGNAYAPSNFVMNGTLTQYAAGTGVITFDDTPFGGRISMGRNKSGSVEFSWVEEDALANGLSRVTVAAISGGSVNGQVSGSFIGSSQSFSLAANTWLAVPIEFSSAPKVNFSDVADLSQDSSLGITRAGLATQLNALSNLPTIQAGLNGNIVIGSQTPPSFVHLNGGQNGVDDWITLWDVATAIDGAYLWVKAFNRPQQITIDGSDFLVDGAEAPASTNLGGGFEVKAGESVLAHLTINNGNRFINVVRMGGNAESAPDRFLDVPATDMVLGAQYWGDADTYGFAAIADPTEETGKSVLFRSLKLKDAGVTTLNPLTVAGSAIAFELEDGTTAATFDVKPGEVVAFTLARRGAAYVLLEMPNDKGAIAATNTPQYVTSTTATIDPYNDGKPGIEGRAYFFDANTITDITLSEPTTLDVAAGVYRWVISMNWAVLAARATPINLITGTATLINPNDLPDGGNESLSIVYSAAGFPGESVTESVKIVSSGDVQISQVFETFATKTTAKASSVRIFQSDGSDVSADGLVAGIYRKETDDGDPIFVG